MPEQEIVWKADLELSKMRVRPSLIETVAIAGFLALGVFLRTWHLDREAVEHFDEGIYASVLWHDGILNAPYPARELYAPPLLSALIELTSLVPGLSGCAPFLPAIMLGSLTVLALWWLARSWFGRAAGIFIAAVVSMSDFHVIYSRMAMTDVPCLLWIVTSVYFGTLAVQRQSFRVAVIAGVTCGLAWWTKYTGWLPLAIIFSGTLLWWSWIGRKSVSAVRTILLLATMLAVTCATFAPWWWQLQAVGGYSAVTANHTSYLQGFSGWNHHLAAQLTFQFWQDGWSGALSLGLGMIAAGLFRWTAARRFTWNRDVGVSILAPHTQSLLAPENANGPPVRLLMRIVASGFALSIFALGMTTPLMLTCIAVSGFGGMFLWPVLRRIWIRRRTGDSSPTTAGAVSLTTGDLESAARIDPALGLCTNVAWFVGLLFATPFYHPYARLFLPLLASIWLAAAGGVSWWLESNVSVARQARAPGISQPRKTWGDHLVTSLVMGAVLFSFLRFDENYNVGLITQNDIFRSSLFMDRSSIVDAAYAAADLCILSAQGKLPLSHWSVSAGGTVVRPEEVLNASVPRSMKPNLTVEDRRREKLVVYVFGEPALLLHLHNAGVMAIPVNHLNLGGPDGGAPTVPAFVIIGPNAKRTMGFWEQWMERVNHFGSVGEVRYRPGEVTLLDLFSARWLREHDEAAVQTFEVHRVQ